MKKGQKVRIKSSGKIGVIADSEFFHWGGRKHVRYEVKVEGQKGSCWYPKEDLSVDLVERAKIIIQGEDGELHLDVSNDNRMDKEGLQIVLTGSPENLKEHRGLHVALATLLLRQLASNS